MTRFAEMLGSRPLLADGAMGTVLYARGVFINRCYDELNLSDPALIEGVHEEYLQAGAEIVETNTFGGSPVTLDEFGIGEKAFEIYCKVRDHYRTIGGTADGIKYYMQLEEIDD